LGLSTYLIAYESTLIQRISFFNINYYTEAAEGNPMDCRDDGAHFTPPLCLLSYSLMEYASQSESEVTIKIKTVGGEYMRVHCRGRDKG
jgi:hypothetical protein